MEESSQCKKAVSALRVQKMICSFLLTCFIMRIESLQPQETEFTNIKTFCYNSSMEGFRLNATVLKVLDVASKSACIDECFADPCCRSINYRHNSMENYQLKNCEILHDLLENFTLETNTSYDHVFFIQPLKAYNSGCFPQPMMVITETYMKSCKDAFENNSSAIDGVYKLRLNKTSEIYRVYCHMSNSSTQCGGGGWTLVMKLDGNKETFKYNSSFWTNTDILNVEGQNETENEIKLASYHYTPFSKICLVVPVKNITNLTYVVLNYNATSLHGVISEGTYIQTHVERVTLPSGTAGNRLPLYCNKGVFNWHHNDSYLRIGIVGNNRDNCTFTSLPDLFIGFGMQKNNSEQSSGNLTLQSTNRQAAFGYILVQ